MPSIGPFAECMRVTAAEVHQRRFTGLINPFQIGLHQHIAAGVEQLPGMGAGACQVVAEAAGIARSLAPGGWLHHQLRQLRKLMASPGRSKVEGTIATPFRARSSR